MDALPMCGAGQSTRRGDSIVGCEGGSGAATLPREQRNVGGTITHSWSKEWHGGAAKLACPGSPRAAVTGCEKDDITPSHIKQFIQSEMMMN